MKYDELKAYINNYPTEHVKGFTKRELKIVRDKITDEFSDEKFFEALHGNTCVINSKKEIVRYHHDVFYAFVCGLENRELTVEEWD